MKRAHQKSIICIVIYAAALSLLTIYGNWQIALGGFLLLWGNNVEHKL